MTVDWARTVDPTVEHEFLAARGTDRVFWQGRAFPKRSVGSTSDDVDWAGSCGTVRSAVNEKLSTRAMSGQ
ncbi:unnamed protein product [Malus baccata var. baccata]